MNNLERQRGVFFTFECENVSVQGCGLWEILFIPHNAFKFLNRMKEVHFDYEWTGTIGVVGEVLWTMNYSSEILYNLKELIQTYFKDLISVRAVILFNSSANNFAERFSHALSTKKIFTSVEVRGGTSGMYSCGKVTLCPGHLSRDKKKSKENL